MALNRERSYIREEPSRDARLIVIYCEGETREADYFRFFQNLSSQLNLEIEKPTRGDNNSPKGLLEKAQQQLKSDAPKYPLDSGDEVWFVFDTDKWGSHITTLRQGCVNEQGWFIAQSNPCFEVWLFYHCSAFKVFSGMEISANWKPFVNQEIKGGFDYRKHSFLIETAITNAKHKLEDENNILNIGCTEVFKLAESFYPLVRAKLAELEEVEEAKKQRITRNAE